MPEAPLGGLKEAVSSPGPQRPRSHVLRVKRPPLRRDQDSASPSEKTPPRGTGFVLAMWTVEGPGHKGSGALESLPPETAPRPRGTYLLRLLLSLAAGLGVVQGPVPLLLPGPLAGLG